MLVLAAFALGSSITPLGARADSPSPFVPPAPSQLVHAPADMPDLGRDDLTLVAIPDLPSDFVVDDRGWIRFAYPASEVARVRPLADAADQARGALSSELGVDVLDRLEVRIARTSTEMASLAPPSIPPPRYAVGVAYARMRLVLLSIEAPQSPELPDLVQVFRHELAHVGLFEAVHGQPVPRWFNEGYAIHASGESSLGRGRTLWQASLGGRLMPLSDIERGFPADGDKAAIAYAQSADFVRFLLRRQDRERFKRLVGRVARGEPFARALGDAYSSNLRGLEFEWREQLKTRYSYVPILLGGGTLWVLVFGAVGIGWYRRRRRHKLTLQRWAEQEAIADARAAGTIPDVIRIKLIPRPPAPPLVHVESATNASTQGLEPSADQGRTTNTFLPRLDVPKVEHDGRWHTLH